MIVKTFNGKNVKEFKSIHNYFTSRMDGIRELYCSDLVKKNTERFVESVKNIKGVKIESICVSVTNDNELVVGLFNGHVFVNVYINLSQILVETRCKEYDEYNVSNLTEVVDFLKKYFGEHNESKGYCYLEK